MAGFVLNALAYIGILVALLRWRREHHKSALPAERFLSAIRVGMRFVMHTRAKQGLREMRRRNGVYFWELFHDSANPSHFVECFMDESWLEHLRQHERVSVADRGIQQRAKRFLVEGTETKSRHLLADREP